LTGPVIAIGQVQNDYTVNRELQLHNPTLVDDHAWNAGTRELGVDKLPAH
jgi:hypothetical protein